MSAENIRLVDQIEKMIGNAIKNIHTATIAKVTKVNEKTIDCQVVIDISVAGKKVTLPEFIEVPPVFAQGGASHIAMPIKAGDYCLLIICEKAFDAWYFGDDNVLPAEFRTHDYSDAFAIVGINPFKAAITIPEITQMIGDVNFEGNHTHEGNMERTGTLTNNGNVTIDGDNDVSGNVEAATYSVGGTAGKTGNFVDKNGLPMKFKNGILVP